MAGSRASGASVAIRKLVEEARRTGDDLDRIRLAQEAAYRFMSVVAGNNPHYEEAIRGLFAGDADPFEQLIAEWPADIRDHTAKARGARLSANAAARRLIPPISAPLSWLE